jgi:hypothetical protein
VSDGVFASKLPPTVIRQVTRTSPRVTRHEELSAPAQPLPARRKKRPATNLDSQLIVKVLLN